MDLCRKCLHAKHQKELDQYNGCCQDCASPPTPIHEPVDTSNSTSEPEHKTPLPVGFRNLIWSSNIWIKYLIKLKFKFDYIWFDQIQIWPNLIWFANIYLIWKLLLKIQIQIKFKSKYLNQIKFKLGSIWFDQIQIDPIFDLIWIWGTLINN